MLIRTQFLHIGAPFGRVYTVIQLLVSYCSLFLWHRCFGWWRGGWLNLRRLGGGVVVGFSCHGNSSLR